MGGFYLIFEVQKSGISEEDFVIHLMEEKNIFLHPGYFFDYEKGIHGIISFLTKEENLREGLERLISY